MMLVLVHSLGAKDPSLQAPRDPEGFHDRKNLDNGLERTALSPRFNGMDADDRFRYASVHRRLFCLANRRNRPQSWLKPPSCLLLSDLHHHLSDCDMSLGHFLLL